jgi:hypothetical protein
MSFLDAGSGRGAQEFTGWTRELVAPPRKWIELVAELLERRALHRRLGLPLSDRMAFFALWIIQRASYNLGWRRGVAEAQRNSPPPVDANSKRRRG